MNCNPRYAICQDTTLRKVSVFPIMASLVHILYFDIVKFQILSITFPDILFLFSICNLQMFYFCETSTSPSIVDKSLELTLVAFAKISKSILLIVKISVDFATGKTFNFPLFKISPS